MAALLAALLLLPSIGLGQEKVRQGEEQGGKVTATSVTEGYILEIKGRELVIDLGTRQGLESGMSIQILTRVSLIHPVTKEKIEDRIPLVTEVVARAGETMSVIVVQNTAPDRIKAGDSVRAEGLSPVVESAPRAVAEQPQCPACEDDPEAKKVHEAWLDTISLPLEERVVRWMRFLKENPTSAYKQNIGAELAFLRRTIYSRQVRPAQPEPGEKAPLLMEHDALRSIDAGTRIAPAIVIVSPDAVNAVKLFHRREGDKLYRMTPMRKFGDSSFMAEVPPEFTEPGALEYFIEANSPSGKRLAASADPNSPHSIAISTPVKPKKDIAGRSHARVAIEWADFYLTRPGEDYFWKSEADLTYRLQWGIMHSFRMGFGVFEGKGGPAKWIEDPDLYHTTFEEEFKPTNLAMTYAYFEPELKVTEYFHVIPRLVVGGVREKQEEGEYDPDVHGGRAVTGIHGYLRIGKDTETNLLMGGSFVDQLGTEALIAMNLGLWDHVPVGISAAATNFPVQADDYAARLLFHAGWRQDNRFSVLFHFGANMRNIRHIGFGGGAGLEFNW